MNHNTAGHTCHGTSYSGLTLTFLAGGIAGAVAGLLLAPRSGQATRELMGRELNAKAESARVLRGRLVDKLADSALAMKGRMVNKVNHVTDSARELKDRAFRKGADIRDEAAYRAEEAASALAGNGTHT